MTDIDVRSQLPSVQRTIRKCSASRRAGRGRSASGKGGQFERDLAHYFNDHLFPDMPQVSRAALSGGGKKFIGSGGGADLTGTPELWVEAKRTETFQPLKALEQAELGRAGNPTSRTDMIAVMNRKNGQPIQDGMVVMRLDEWARLYRAFLIHEGYIRD